MFKNKKLNKENEYLVEILEDLKIELINSQHREQKYQDYFEDIEDLFQDTKSTLKEVKKKMYELEKYQIQTQGKKQKEDTTGGGENNNNNSPQMVQ